MSEHLFYEGDLSSIRSTLSGHVKEEVDGIHIDQFLITPEDDLVSHCVESLRIEPLMVYMDRIQQEHAETKVDVSGDFRRSRGLGPCYTSGIRIKLSLPFTGDPALFRISPHSMFMSPRPFGRVTKGHQSGIGIVEMTFDFPTDEQPENIKKRVDENLRYLENCLARQKQEIDNYNNLLPEAVGKAVKARMARLKQHDKIARILEIPLKHKEGAPIMAHIPIKKKIITPLPPPPKGGYKPEPGIDNAVYLDILRILRHEGRTWETTPKTYFVHPEEELRDILLAHLNGHYQGSASGETFRRNGKTDIHIEDSNRSAFVAECKIWEGSKKLSEGIDQLLSYLTWRDCKTAFLIFNKHNAGFSDLITKIPVVFDNHPRKMKKNNISEPGEWQYVFRSQDDDSRLLYIHVFAFNIYVK